MNILKIKPAKTKPDTEVLVIAAAVLTDLYLIYAAMVVLVNKI